MISGLTGIVNYKRGQVIELLVGQISFSVLAPLPLLNVLAIGTRVTLYTKMVVAEKLIELYGFEKREDTETFEMLTSVSGVGPRTALEIFNQKQGREIRKAIGQADANFFLEIKGIGRKTAQRLIVDLRSVLDDLKLQEKKMIRKRTGLVYGALIQLGFSQQEIDLVIPRLSKGASDEENIGQALKLLSRQ
jgi:Holliday junction DNA helicase RuvA